MLLLVLLLESGLEIGDDGSVLLVRGGFGDLSLVGVEHLLDSLYFSVTHVEGGLLLAAREEFLHPVLTALLDLVVVGVLPVGPHWKYLLIIQYKYVVNSS